MATLRESVGAEKDAKGRATEEIMRNKHRMDK